MFNGKSAYLYKRKTYCVDCSIILDIKKEKIGTRSSEEEPRSLKAVVGIS